MTELLPYSPSDFLLFSPRVYVRLFGLRNAVLWPLPVAAIVLGAALITLVAMGRATPVRLALAALGIVWLWLAWSFFWIDYAAINWASRYVAPLAALEGGLLITYAVLAGSRNGCEAKPQTRWAPALQPWGAIALATISVVGYPLIAPFMGRPWGSAEVFAIAPDPTAVATLALLAALNIRGRWLLMLVPACWCALTGLTLWVMQAGDFFVAPACAVVAIAFILCRVDSVRVDRLI